MSLSTRLKDKRCVITGAGSGIGRAIATRLAAEGLTVGVFDINPQGAAQTVATIEAASAVVVGPERAKPGGQIGLDEEGPAAALASEIARLERPADPLGDGPIARERDAIPLTLEEPRPLRRQRFGDRGTAALRSGARRLRYGRDDRMTATEHSEKEPEGERTHAFRSRRKWSTSGS